MFRRATAGDQPPQEPRFEGALFIPAFPREQPFGYNVSKFRSLGGQGLRQRVERVRTVQPSFFLCVGFPISSGEEPLLSGRLGRRSVSMKLYNQEAQPFLPR